MQTFLGIPVDELVDIVALYRQDQPKEGDLGDFLKILSKVSEEDAAVLRRVYLISVAKEQKIKALKRIINQVKGLVHGQT